MFAWMEDHPDLGRVDVCVNNAGLSSSESLLEGRVEDWRRMLDVNVVALSLCTQLAVQLIFSGHPLNTLEKQAPMCTFGVGGSPLEVALGGEVVRLEEAVRSRLRGGA